MHFKLSKQREAQFKLTSARSRKGDPTTEDTQERLVEAICDTKIVQRIYAELEDELTYDELRNIVQRERKLSEPSGNRRGNTLAKWLTALPEVKPLEDSRDGVCRGDTFGERYVE